MLALGNAKIFVYTESVDMRCSFDRLSYTVADVLKQDSFSGHYFVFFSRCRRKMKILQWDKDGYVMYYKRLEQGTFDISRWLENKKGASLEIDKVHFAMMMAGISFADTKKQKRFAKSPSAPGHQNYRVTDNKLLCFIAFGLGWECHLCLSLQTSVYFAFRRKTTKTILGYWNTAPSRLFS